MRISIALAAVLLVAACGGGRGVSGPIGQACMTSGRSAASTSLCSCIQGVADQTLSSSEQRRAAQYFADPQRAQDFRTRDDAGSEAAWRRYRDFADRAQARCG